MPARRPLYFGPLERRLFGWFHPQAAGAPPARSGLIIVNPFGYEAICAHRSLRHFAEAAAAAGIPAIRFDNDGTGDSIGDDRDPDRLGAWVRGVQLAADELRREANVERLFILGVRLGAALAALAAEGRDDVAGLVAIAPVVSGRAYVRELRALQMALGLAPPPPGVKPTPEDEQEAIGFVLTAETRDALGKVDLTKRAKPPAAEVLILDRSDLPTGAKWAEQLSAQGAAVDRRQMKGYVEMVLDPHNAIVPVELIGAAVDWMKERAGAPLTSGTSPTSGVSPTSGASPTSGVSPTGGASPTSGASPASSTSLGAVPLNVAPYSISPRPIEAVAEGGVIETAVLLDRRVRAFGILTSPPPGSKPAGMTILLLNAGAVLHLGPNRLYVTLARRLAALGHTVLRMDLAGLGDSGARPDIAENTVYPSAAMDDVLIGLAHLALRTGGAPTAVVGLCSGAYHAFKAAVKGLPVARVIALNPLTFFWKEGSSLDIAAAHSIVSESQRMLGQARSVEGWRKVLSGKVNLRSAVRVVGLRAAAELTSIGREVARRAGVLLSDDLPSELLTIARRDIDLRFVFAGGDPGLGLLRLQGGHTVEKLKERGKLHISVVPRADHTFTQVWSHELLLALLIDELTRPLPSR